MCNKFRGKINLKKVKNWTVEVFKVLLVLLKNLGFF